MKKRYEQISEITLNDENRFCKQCNIMFSYKVI